MNKKKTMIVRVDKEVWYKCRALMPGEHDSTISRMMYRWSVFRPGHKFFQPDKKIEKRLTKKVGGTKNRGV